MWIRCLYRAASWIARNDSSLFDRAGFQDSDRRAALRQQRIHQIQAEQIDRTASAIQS